MDSAARTTRGTRRIPRQARSRERMARILASAAELIVSDGAEGLTMHRIAEHAELPVSSLYAYFADRDAIIDALVTDLLAEHEDVLRSVLNTAGLDDLTIAAEAIYDQYVNFYRTHPSFRAVRTSTLFLSTHRKSLERSVDTLLEQLASSPVAAGLSVDDLRLPWDVADAILEAAFRDRPMGAEQLIHEGRFLVTTTTRRVLDAHMRRSR